MVLSAPASPSEYDNLTAIIRPSCPQLYFCAVKNELSFSDSEVGLGEGLRGLGIGDTIVAAVMKQFAHMVC